MFAQPQAGVEPRKQGSSLPGGGAEGVKAERRQGSAGFDSQPQQPPPGQQPSTGRSGMSHLSSQHNSHHRSNHHHQQNSHHSQQPPRQVQNKQQQGVSLPTPQNKSNQQQPGSPSQTLSRQQHAGREQGPDSSKGSHYHSNQRQNSTGGLRHGGNRLSGTGNDDSGSEDKDLKPHRAQEHPKREVAGPELSGPNPAESETSLSQSLKAEPSGPDSTSNEPSSKRTEHEGGERGSGGEGVKVKREAPGEDSGAESGKSLREEGGRSELRWGQRKRLRCVRSGSAGSAGVAVSWTADAWSSREENPQQHPGHPPRPRQMSVPEGLGDVERHASVGDEAQQDPDDPLEKKARKGTSRIRHSGSASSNSSGGQGSQWLEGKGSESAPSAAADGSHRGDKDHRAIADDSGGAGAARGGEEKGEGGSDLPRTTKDHPHSKSWLKSGGDAESPPNGCYPGSKAKGKPSVLTSRASEEAAAPAEGPSDAVATRRGRGPNHAAESSLKEANSDPEDAQKPLAESNATHVKAGAAAERGPSASAVDAAEKPGGLSAVAGEPPRQQRSNSPLQGTHGQRSAGVGRRTGQPVAAVRQEATSSGSSSSSGGDSAPTGHRGKRHKGSAHGGNDEEGVKERQGPSSEERKGRRREVKEDPDENERGGRRREDGAEKAEARRGGRDKDKDGSEPVGGRSSLTPIREGQDDAKARVSDAGDQGERPEQGPSAKGSAGNRHGSGGGRRGSGNQSEADGPSPAKEAQGRRGQGGGAGPGSREQAQQSPARGGTAEQGAREGPEAAPRHAPHHRQAHQEHAHSHSHAHPRSQHNETPPHERAQRHHHHQHHGSTRQQAQALKGQLQDRFKHKEDVPLAHQQAAAAQAQAQAQAEQQQQMQEHSRQFLGAPELVELPKFLLTLSRGEKEEDFAKTKGTKLPQRPKKRTKAVEKCIHRLLPGAWLVNVTRERYEVREKKSSKKKPRGLKAMNGYESESE